MEMFMSGAGTGIQVLIRRERCGTASALVPVPAASAGAAVGAMTPGSAGQRFATGTLRRSRSATWASAP